MPKVFVYGSLKSGYQYHYLLQGIKGYPAIAPHIDLYAGPHYPFAIRGRGQAIGEIYTINTVILHQLDALENHPYDYHREITPVIFLQDKKVNAWIYLNKKAYRYPRILTGCW